jgi:hypothetical protein
MVICHCFLRGVEVGFLGDGFHSEWLVWLMEEAAGHLR